MIKLIYEGYNGYDIIELFYDKSNCNYILIINGKKKIIKNISENNVKLLMKESEEDI
jgi:hypothetical protein